MFSQNDEEEIILGHFGEKSDGRLLDIGAFDGSCFSNSRALIDRGWNAVMVEPSPWPFASMTRLYWDNARVVLINAAVVPQDHPAVATASLMNFLATEDAISCQEERTAQMWGREKFRNILVRPVGIMSLPVGPYDFVSIDVEDGTMPLVNDMIRRTKILQNASLVCLEHTAGGVPCREEMTRAMEAIGKHVIHETRENFIFA